ncbi:holo-ACP synthase [Urbifossiella limnaea]|uniref:Holo-[acyl-carrier-protein] synthase n=1 Tax=Urbifossiella limnaea TaxID=2528023 RepID=A0A517XVD9_9BACT|nr:4'-phosphopantetheinyl transferase superfamily protein [Urbifossiella limnaea]QDU21444.1 Holo-[acyl-carrier-protein] synthase [Urbifossiella limnaea]
MIVGIGTQVLECARVRKLIDRHGEAFLRRVYTDREIGRCNADPRTTEAFAAVWAAKDAVFRALGSPWRRGMDWTDVEIGAGNAVAVAGATADRMTAKGASRVMVTTAFCRAFATATGIALADRAG